MNVRISFVSILVLVAGCGARHGEERPDLADHRKAVLKIVSQFYDTHNKNDYDKLHSLFAGGGSIAELHHFGSSRVNLSVRSVEEYSNTASAPESGYFLRKDAARFTTTLSRHVAQVWAVAITATGVGSREAGQDHIKLKQVSRVTTVDGFTLINTVDGWRIIQLVRSRGSGLEQDDAGAEVEAAIAEIYRHSRSGTLNPGRFAANGAILGIIRPVDSIGSFQMCDPAQCLGIIAGVPDTVPPVITVRTSDGIAQASVTRGNERASFTLVQVGGQWLTVALIRQQW